MSFFDKTTLSNQDDHVIDKDVSEETSTDDFMTPTDTFLWYLTIYSDFIYSLFLIIWLIIFRIYAKIKRQYLDDYQLDVQDYAVWLSGIPWKGTKESELM